MKKIQNDLVPPKQIVSGLSERVNWAILRAMSPDAEQRPMSCREFIEDLTGHSTRRVSMGQPPSQQDIWYLIYKDEAGTTHTVKGNTPAIRRSFRDGLLGDAGNIRASRAKTGPFAFLRDHPEFRDLLVTAAALPVADGEESSDELTAQTQPMPREPRPSSSKSPTVRSPAGAALAPHIALEKEAPGRGGLGWVSWVLLLLLMVVSAVAAFWFLPEQWWQ
jgi:hypothetical protein